MKKIFIYLLMLFSFQWVNSQEMAPPQNLRAIQISHNTIVIKWDYTIGPSDKISGYWVSKDGRHQYVSSSTTEYAFSGLAPCTEYVFSVQAFVSSPAIGVNTSPTVSIRLRTTSGIPEHITLNSTVNPSTANIPMASGTITLKPGFYSKPSSNANYFQAKISSNCNNLKSQSIDRFEVVIPDEIKYAKDPLERDDDVPSKKSISKSMLDQEELAQKTSNINPEEQISIYPNPVSSILTVQYPAYKGGESIILFDLIGKVVCEYPLTDRVCTIDMSSLAQGVYFLKIKSGKGIIPVQKLIKSF